MGEYGLYAHPDYVPIKQLKRVPWCVTTADDTGSRIVETNSPTDDIALSVEDQLEHLGYK
jgi:hypothetical protein